MSEKQSDPRPWLAEARRKSAEARQTAARERRLTEARELLESAGYVITQEV